MINCIRNQKYIILRNKVILEFSQPKMFCGKTGSRLQFRGNIKRPHPEWLPL
jgi:hypothetical protein